MMLTITHMITWCLHTLCQTGKTRWLKLRVDNHQIIGKTRSCGTPGCCLPDWHSGPHTWEKVACRSETKQEIPIRRSPRFIHVPFPWHALDINLQALVLLQLSHDTCELLSHLARLARVIRPMRAIILRAMQLNEDVETLLSSSFIANDCKIGCGSSLKGVFWGMHRKGDESRHINEHMLVELRLMRPAMRPRSWKWMLQFHHWASMTRVDVLQLACLQLFYNPSQRIGQLRCGGRKRRHTFCEHLGRAYNVRRDAIEEHGLCVCKTNDFMYPALATVSEDVLTLTSNDNVVFTWTLSREAACVLKLVRAFV